MVTPEVKKAIEQIEAANPDSVVTVREDGEGGAYVIVETVDLPEVFEPRTTWFGFRITFQYPLSDVYPLFVRGDLRYADGRAMAGEGVQQGHQFEGRSAVQLSRRANRLDPRTDTALLKMTKVLKWLEERS